MSVSSACNGSRRSDSTRATVADAVAGASGVYRVPLDGGAPELYVSGPGLVGLAFGPEGQLVVVSNDSAYLLDDGKAM